ncbi:hypothetical protein DYB37_006098 [Aphanomyces astaci]|uniref:Cation/H+ exchanger transmembrane domain-containing protein n=1 Tax=Aphanomyces astaci TaxID=112090 RepID=A0A3R7BIX0_APHAT|nr:hypothetical protein DYB37_006098 [Aphanomyces astaci]
MGWISIDSSNPLEALLFGALISAVDPVATLSILGNPELNLDPLLYRSVVIYQVTTSSDRRRSHRWRGRQLTGRACGCSLVFGESVLNDAVSIVLFNTFLKFTYGAIWLLLIEFAMISLGSVVVGFATGYVQANETVMFATHSMISLSGWVPLGMTMLCRLGCSLLCKNTNMNKYPKYEITMLFLFAYGSYSLAEVIKLSGIMSLFFCGITMAHYNTTNLSTTSQVRFQCYDIHTSYTRMGLLLTCQFGRWDVKFMVLAIVFCLIGRLFNIFPLSWVANWQRKEKVTAQMQVVLWFAGLRGAIAFALSQDMPGANRDLYTTTTLSVVIFTTIVCGGLTEPLLKQTKLKAAASDHPASPDGTAAPSSSMRLRQLSVESEISYVESFWGNLDEKYMKPVFGGAPRRLISRNVPSATSPLAHGGANPSPVQ